MKLDTEELRRTEERCNALIALEEDYHHVIRSVEEAHGVKIRERLVQSIIGGGAGPVHVLLEEELPQMEPENAHA